MIEAFKALFQPQPRESTADREHRLHLAAAAMLIETARADFSTGGSEQAALEQLLATSLELSTTEVHSLVLAATAQVDAATSLYEFTRPINDHYRAEEKYTLVSAMWQVAYADGNLDKYEEALIRRVAELIYLPHSDYIRSKLAAQP